MPTIDAKKRPSGPEQNHQLKASISGTTMTFSSPRSKWIRLCASPELLSAGTYTVNLTGRDRAGNTFATNCRFSLGSQSTGVSGATVADNPYNPAVGNTSIHYTLAKASHVTIKVYDWAGDFVGAVFNDYQSAGPQAVDWAAQTEDGKALSNGVYFIRIVADDGIRQEPSVVKVAVWNER